MEGGINPGALLEMGSYNPLHSRWMWGELQLSGYRVSWVQRYLQWALLCKDLDAINQSKKKSCSEVGCGVRAPCASREWCVAELALIVFSWFWASLGEEWLWFPKEDMTCFCNFNMWNSCQSAWLDICPCHVIHKHRQSPVLAGSEGLAAHLFERGNPKHGSWVPNPLKDVYCHPRSVVVCFSLKPFCQMQPNTGQVMWLHCFSEEW